VKRNPWSIDRDSCVTDVIYRSTLYWVALVLFCKNRLSEAAVPFFTALKAWQLMHLFA
jgi:hypothetical protein